MDLQELNDESVAGDWFVENGTLKARVGSETFDFVFEKGDPLSDAMVSFLNHLKYLRAAAKDQA